MPVNTQRRALWLTGVGHASGHSWELIFPAVAVPMARDMGLPFDETVQLSFVLYLLYGLGAPLAGWLSDRIGGRRVLILCLLGGGTAGTLVSFVEGPWMLRLALGALGLFASLYHPAGLSLLSRRFDARIGRAFAINGIAGNIGIAATPLLAGLMASLFGWRSAYFALCLPGLLFGLIFSCLPFPDDHEPAPPTEAPKDEPRFDFVPLVLFAFAVTFGGLAYRLQTLVLPALLESRVGALPAITSLFDFFEGKNTGNLVATALTSFAYTMGMFGQWWGGKLADRGPLIPTYLWFHLGALPLVAIAAFASGPLLVLALLGYSFFGFGMQPAENSLVARLTPSRFRGRAYAGKFVLAFGVGSTGTFIVGWVEPLGGLGASLATAAVLELALLLAGLALFFHLRSRGRTI